MSKLFKFAIGGVPALVVDHYMTKNKAESRADSKISKTEVEHICEVIEKAKEQGLREITIEISSELSDEISITGNLPVDIGPVGATLGSKNSGNGKCQLHLVFSEKDALDKLEKLKTLYDSEAITQEEFEKAKLKVIESL